MGKISFGVVSGCFFSLVHLVPICLSVCGVRWGCVVGCSLSTPVLGHSRTAGGNPWTEGGARWVRKAGETRRNNTDKYKLDAVCEQVIRRRYFASSLPELGPVGPCVSVVTGACLGMAYGVPAQRHGTHQTQHRHPKAAAAAASGAYTHRGTEK